MLPTETSVLVIGFGPTGATIANLLGRYGVPTLVVDRATEVFPLPRAIALDNEALRILQLAGLDEGAFDTVAIHEVCFRSRRGEPFARARTGGSLDGHPKLVTFHQPDLEAALRERVRDRASVTTALGVELVGLREQCDGVVARLRTRDGAEHRVSARYVVGADGASSRVRDALGLGFMGKSYAEDWLIVDARNPAKPFDHVEFICDPRRPTPHMVAPGDRQRWEFMLLPGETREEMESPEKVHELLAPWGDSEQMEIERTAVYRFHACTVERFRKGRVFLAGDAAHVTPPFVGQGLVAGLRDAANLSWKLAWVLLRSADTSILDSYDVERRPHARAMIAFARFAGHIVMPTNRVASTATSLIFRAIRLIPSLRSYFEDLRIKPRNRYRRGLFMKPVNKGKIGSRVALEPGVSFPQVWVERSDGVGAWSDEALGPGFALVGFGVDPGRFLSERSQIAWKGVDGSVVQLCHRGQRLNCGKERYEDLTGALVPGSAPVGWACVVRPDRIVLHQGPAAEADRLVFESLAMLGLPTDPNTPARKSWVTDRHDPPEARP